MQINWNKRKLLHKKGIKLPQEFVSNTNMVAVSSFWNTIMAAVSSCKNAGWELKG